MLKRNGPAERGYVPKLYPFVEFKSERRRVPRLSLFCRRTKGGRRAPWRLSLIQMLIQHCECKPNLHQSAWAASTATLIGDVRVGANARISYGAVLIAEHGSMITIGSECVVMENAVLRSSKRFDITIGERTLIGPHAYLTGCQIGSRSFIATGAMIFNGARLGEGCGVWLGGKVHIGTELPKGSVVPIGFIASGRPFRLFSPTEAPEALQAPGKPDFAEYVFGAKSPHTSTLETMDEIMPRYAAALAAHADDTLLT